VTGGEVAARSFLNLYFLAEGGRNGDLKVHFAKRIALTSALLLLPLSSALSQTGDRPSVIQTIAEQVRPSVVEIVGRVEGSGDTSYGTGFAFHEPGVVVTNAHVVRGVSDLMVRTLDGALLASVTVLDVDEELDLAVLRVVGFDAEPLPLSERTTPPIGTAVIAVGHPRGYQFTVSEGIVSAVRALDAEGIELIQTTAPISPGSSGGPLLDERGNVVGICSLTLTEGQNINFAVPSSHLGPAVEAALTLERGTSGNDATAMPAAQLIGLSRKHRRDGNLVHAEQLVRRALRVHPDDVGLLQEAAEVAWSRGRYSEAQAIVDRIATIDPDHAPSRQVRASLLAQKGKCEEAVLEARASLRTGLEPDQGAEAHAVLGECLGRLGEASAALTHVARALENARIAEIPDYHALHAFLLQADGREDEADQAAVSALVLAKWDPIVVAALRERGLPRLVEVISSRGRRDGADYVVRGIVRNRGPVPLEQIVITAEGENGRGGLVATGTGSVLPHRLVPGQTGSFEVRLSGSVDEVSGYEVRVVEFDEP